MSALRAPVAARYSLGPLQRNRACGRRRRTVVYAITRAPQEKEEAEARATTARPQATQGHSEPAQPLPVVDERGLKLREDRSESGPLFMGAKPAAAAAAAADWQQWWQQEVVGQVKPELVAIALVYLVQGLLGLSRLAVFVYLKDELGLAPATVALVTSSGYAPWMIKPVYGFLSDAVPLFGYRRKSYLAFCGLLGAVAWGSMATIATTPTAVVALLVLGSLSTACADVVADSVVVEIVRRPGSSLGTAGSLQSLCWAAASAGGIASAYFSGSLVNDYGPRTVFGLTAFFPLLVTAAAVAIPEQRIVAPPKGVMRSTGEGGSSSSSSSGSGVGRSRSSSPPEQAWRSPEGGVMAAFKSQAKLLWATGRQRRIFLPALFVFCWQATPNADTAMLFFETNQLGFTSEVLGRIRLVGALASLAGVGLFNFRLKHVPLRRILVWTAVAGAALGLTQLMLVTGVNRQLGISDQLFALADTALLTVLAQVAFMPLLVLAARICPEGVEATLFATLMSISNSGMFLGNALGSALTAALGVTADKYDNLALLVTLCTLSALAPLPLLRMLPDEVDKERPEGGGGQGERKES